MGAARILVAEDDRVVSMLVSRSLEASGARVTAVYDGIDAYEMGKSGEFDLALLDQVMPGLLGAEVLQRWSDDGVDLPVIMLSGLTSEEDIVACLDLGAVDFVRKPFNVREVLARVRVQLRAAGVSLEE
ncbi:response regulator MprA [bacterium BMS3Abin02]|nr:response regulator MprA [bacterium BMS3Abin02]GBE20981.1 response regulator MprA [bacterium BMS3Bbin01]HDH26152.1 response regulator transcription factor [Actinomycetota bacterium]